MTTTKTIFGALPAKSFAVLYADPPWQVHTWSHRGEGKGAVQHYPCMSLREICELPVVELAADDAVLFLWVVQPMLPEALDVMRAWGFQFRTVAFYWVKMPAGWVDDVQGSRPFGAVELFKAR